MKTKVLGKTQLKLSVIGLGTWAIGEEGVRNRLNPQNDQNSIDTILKAIDSGVNWIDTAPSYGFGYSEKVVGQAVKISGKKPLISTKCGLVRKNNKVFSCLKETSLRSEIEASLERLGLGAIDLYQIHRPFPEEDLERAWTVLARLADEGKVRYLGVSNFRIEQLKCLRPIRPVDFIQTHYSLLFRDNEDLIEYCGQNNIGVLAYSPIERGLLAGKSKPAEVHRLKNPELVESLRPIALRNKISLAQLAIAWVLSRPAITAALVGARFPFQIEETAVSADLTLPEDDLKEIEKLVKKGRIRKR